MNRVLLIACLLFALVGWSWAMLPDDPGTQYDLALSSDGKLAATCGNQTDICLWSVSGHRLVHKLSGHRGWVYALAFSPDSSQLASGSGDGTIRCWDARSGRGLGVLVNPRSKVRSLAWLSANRLAASCDGELCLIDPASRKISRPLPGVDAYVLRASPDRRRLAVAGGGAREGSIVLLDLATGKTGPPCRMSWAVESVDIAPDGRVVGGSGDGWVSVWKDGKPVFSVRNDDNVYQVRFSPDGRYILTVSNRATRLLDAADGKTVLELAAGGSENAFLPDGKMILASDGIINLRLLDAATGATAAVFGKL